VGWFVAGNIEAVKCSDAAPHSGGHIKTNSNKTNIPMKTSSIKTLLLGIGIAAVCASPAAQASLLSYESFDTTTGYSTGALATQNPSITGYSGAWTFTNFGTQSPTVSASSLDYTGSGYAVEAGGSIGVPNNTSGGEIAGNGSNSGRVYRLLDSSLQATASTNGTLYLSWLFQDGRETGATTYQMLHLNQGTDGDTNRAFGAGLTNDGGQTGNIYDFSVNGAVSNTGVNADTSVHLFVAKFTLSSTAASDSVTVWLDPTIGIGDPSGGTTVSGVNLVWNTLMFSDYDGNSANWDEIRWGTTYVDVVPEPGTFAMLLSGVGMLSLIRRRRA
jgi:hypothetical protein